MTTPRITVRRLAFLLLLPGCHTWRPVTLAPNSGYRHDGKVRFERRVQSTSSTGAPSDGSAGGSDTRVVFDGAWVNGDTLFGGHSAGPTRHAVAVADVRRAEERRVSSGRTTLLVVGTALGVVVGFLALALGTN